jgi:hypothetical protein
MTLLAGWLFADLLLGVTVVAIGASDSPGSTTTTMTTTTANPCGRPEPDCGKPPPGPPGVDPRPVRFEVKADASALLANDRGEAGRVVRRIRTRLARTKVTRRRAAFVLTFGTSPSSAEGTRLASAANALLPRAGSSVFADATYRNFHSIVGNSARRGVLEFEIYLFT